MGTRRCVDNELDIELILNLVDAFGAADGMKRRN